MTWHDRTARALWSWDPTQDPRDADPPAPAVKYRCLDCCWTGGAVAATDHHRESRHHQIVNAAGMLARFSCCAGMP